MIDGEAMTGAGRQRLATRARSVQESVTLAIAAEAKRMKSAGIDVVSLSTGEPDFPTPPVVKAGAFAAIEEDFTRYTQAEGIPPLREAIARKFTSENGVATEASRCIVTAGGKQALATTLMAIVEEGDEVLIPSPYWTSYPELVRLAGAEPILVGTTAEERYKATAARLERFITPRTRCLILNSPSNPTGVMYTRREIEEIAELARGKGLFVLSDELYEKIVYDGNEHVSIGSLEGMEDLAVTINGVSKAFAMTGWRIGYMTGPQDLVDAAARLQSQIISSPNSISQRAALVALTSAADDVTHMVGAFARRRDLIIDLARTIPGIRFERPDGAFYLFIDASEQLERAGITSARFCEQLLRDHHVATIPGSAFGVEGAIRLSYAASEEEIIKGMKRLKEGLGGL